MAMKFMTYTIEICKENNIPSSLQASDVDEIAKLFKGKKIFLTLSDKRKEIIAKWNRVFSNKIALGLSFRNKTSYDDFLKVSANFDYDTIDCFISLSTKCTLIKNNLKKSLVNFHI